MQELLLHAWAVTALRAGRKHYTAKVPLEMVLILTCSDKTLKYMHMFPTLHIYFSDEENEI